MPYRLPLSLALSPVLALNLSLNLSLNLALAPNLNLFYRISWSRARSATPAAIPKKQMKFAPKQGRPKETNLQGAFSTLSAFLPLNPSSFCSFAVLEGRKLRTAAGRGRQIG